MLKKVAVLTILMALTGGVLGLAAGAVGDGSVEWPYSGDECVDRWVPADEPELARLDWQCFKSCWKACYKSCVQECFWWSRLPPVYNACLAACAGACATICGRACWF